MSTLNSFYFQLVPISTEEARSRVSQPRASLQRDDSRGSYLPQRFLFPKNKDRFLLNHFSFLDPTIQSFHNPNHNHAASGGDLHVNLPFPALPQAAIYAGEIPYSLSLPQAAIYGQDFPMLPQAAICIVTLCCLRRRSA